jgi:hypothetical protein
MAWACIYTIAAIGLLLVVIARKDAVRSFGYTLISIAAMWALLRLLVPPL